MTPKEKAVELVQRFINEAYAETTEQLYTPIAKKAALIAVDEILQYIHRINEEYQRRVLNDSHWQEIKQEIENL